MHFTVKEAMPLQKTIQVTVTAQEINVVIDEIEQRYRSKVKAPGFREGHAPLEMVRKQFQEEMEHEAKTAVVDKQIPGILADIKLMPVTQMAFDVQAFPVRDQEFAYAFSFYYLPVFTLPEYEGAPLTVTHAPVQEQEVEAILENLRRSKPVRTPVAEPRTPLDGDMAVIDFAILAEDGKPEANLQGSDVTVFVGDSDPLIAFEEALRNVMLGEEKEQSVTFPADFQHPVLAGAERMLRIKLKSLATLSPPPLDDTFAKSIDPAFTSLDALRQAVQEDLGKRKEARCRQTAVAQLLDDLLSKVDFPLPAGMVERYAQYVMADVRGRMARSGKTLADVSKTEEQFEADARAEAERICQKQVFLLRLAQQEGLTVPDREVSNHIRREAQQRGIPYPQALANYTTSGQILTLREQFLADKAMDALYQKAHVTRVPAS